MVKPDGHDQVSMRKKIEESRSQIDSEWDTTNHDLSCLDASMISYADSSIIDEREVESDALGSTRVIEPGKKESQPKSSHNVLKIEATLDDEVMTSTQESQ